jgi:hypothetical protein
MGMLFLMKERFVRKIQDIKTKDLKTLKSEFAFFNLTSFSLESSSLIFIFASLYNNQLWKK